MTSLLSKVTKSTASKTGLRLVIAGVEKVGKTTLACNAPAALLIPLESGYSGVNVNTTPMITSYDDYDSLLNEIIAECQKGKFHFRSIVTDSATVLERLIHDKTIQRDNGWSKGNPKAITMESALGGYGKAYNHANDLFGNILGKLDQLAQYGGINVIFTSHVFPSRVVDPTAGEYDCWDILLHSPKNNRTYGKREMITQWADIVGFLHEPIFVSKAEDSKFSRAISANKGRILGVERTPGYVAGNRLGMKGEIPIAKDQCWNYLADAIYKISGINVFNT